MHQALEGLAPAPLALQVARLCKEFPCYGPEEAERALRRAPVGWLDEVIEARHYADAKALYDRTKPEDLEPLIQGDPLLDLVDEIFMERAAARLRAEEDETTP